MEDRRPPDGARTAPLAPGRRTAPAGTNAPSALGWVFHPIFNLVSIAGFCPACKEKAGQSRDFPRFFPPRRPRRQKKVYKCPFLCYTKKNSGGRRAERNAPHRLFHVFHCPGGASRRSQINDKSRGQRGAEPTPPCRRSGAGQAGRAARFSVRPKAGPCCCAPIFPSPPSGRSLHPY